MFTAALPYLTVFDPANMFFSVPTRNTSVGADVVILGGDLNMHPQDLGSRLLRSYTGLRDSYLETAQFDVSSEKNGSVKIHLSAKIQELKN